MGPLPIGTQYSEIGEFSNNTTPVGSKRRSRFNQDAGYTEVGGTPTAGTVGYSTVGTPYTTITGADVDDDDDFVIAEESVEEENKRNSLMAGCAGDESSSSSRGRGRGVGVSSDGAGGNGSGGGAADRIQEAPVILRRHGSGVKFRGQTPPKLPPRPLSYAGLSLQTRHDHASGGSGEPCMFLPVGFCGWFRVDVVRSHGSHEQRFA
jgi:hypothetical protein